jgi:predicted nuclease of predicted toxin-antitoxin system
VKFLVDAQLPVRLARRIADAGHDVVHTTDLPDGNRTSDADIADTADADERVVVTKDRDFRDSHLLRSTPQRLLIVTTGNISNDELTCLFDRHLEAIVTALQEVPFVELGPDRLIVHDDR